MCVGRLQNIYISRRKLFGKIHALTKPPFIYVCVFWGFPYPKSPAGFSISSILHPPQRRKANFCLSRDSEREKRGGGKAICTMELFFTFFPKPQGSFLGSSSSNQSKSCLSSMDNAAYQSINTQFVIPEIKSPSPQKRYGSRIRNILFSFFPRGIVSFLWLELLGAGRSAEKMWWVLLDFSATT